MTAVLYCRYSSESQTENSIEGQLRECKDFAERNGITILSSYIDRALSAKTDNRPQFQKMVKDSAKNLFDAIIVWKLDRFARNRYDSAHYKAVLRKNGVKVISATESISEDSTGILLESLLEGYAEFFSAELSEKVIRGMTENAHNCKYNGGTVPLGYTIDSNQCFQIDPVTAPIVQEIFTKYSQGATIVGLVKELSNKGIHSGRNGKISIDMIKRTLSNRRYIGEYSYRDVVVPDGVPAIVSQELFDRVQERLAKNKKAPARFKAEDRYLLSTKLFCGHCGSTMVGESGTSRTMTVHRYYKCANTKKKKLCNKKNVKKDWIENLIVDETMKMLMSDALVDHIADTVLAYQQTESSSLPLLRQQLVETDKGIQNMLNAIQQGIFTSSTKERLDSLEETKRQIEISILQEELQKPPITKEQIVFWLKKFRLFDVSDREQRQKLIDVFINAVYLFDDKLVLTFNYRDGSKTVSLQEIQGLADGSDLCGFGAPCKQPPDWAVAYLCRRNLNPRRKHGVSRAAFSIYIKVSVGMCNNRTNQQNP